VPKLTIDGVGAFEVPEGKKLVLAIEDAGVDILHRCGGVPACTTCRVEVLEGSPDPASDEEIETLEEPDLIAKYRLSCQVRCTSDMTVRVWGRVSTTDFDGAGDRPED